MRVLVVDDEPQLQRALELEGYDVALAGDGDELSYPVVSLELPA